MRYLPVLVLVLGLAFSTLVSAVPERLSVDDRRLELKAETKACYLGFIRLYGAAYFRATDDTVDAARCVRLSYLREFSADELGESTMKVFSTRHGDAVSARFYSELQQTVRGYRSVGIGSRFTYGVEPDDSGVLRRDGQTVLRLKSNDFADRFMQTWGRSEDRSAQPRWAFGQC